MALLKGLVRMGVRKLLSGKVDHCAKLWGYSGSVGFKTWAFTACIDVDLETSEG